MANYKTTPAPSEKGYRVICISLYDRDLARLDAQIGTLKKNGCTKASRSSVIRFALKRAFEMDPAGMREALTTV